MKITAEQIMSWGPCIDYPEARVRKLVGEGKTPKQIVEMRGVPALDRAWVLLRDDVMGVGLYAVLASIIERRLTCERNAGREPDPRSWAVVPRLRRIASGEDVPPDEIESAWAAAMAGWDPAGVAVWDELLYVIEHVINHGTEPETPPDLTYADFGRFAGDGISRHP